jgi:hypothetical protein
MNVVPMTGTWDTGTHGRLPTTPEDGPVLLCSDPAAARTELAATEVKDLVLTLAGVA